MDERIGILLLVFVIVTIVGIFDSIQYRIGKSLFKDHELGVGSCLVVIVVSLVHMVMVVIAGWVDMLLWNLVAPKLDLPQIDLITAIALGWLIGFLFRGISPMRVRVFGTID